MHPSFTPLTFANATHITPATLARFEAYVGLLQQWNPRINLVAESTLPLVWWRHVMDCAQLFPMVKAVVDRQPDASLSLADIGSGAGFPGLVLALLAEDGAPENALKNPPTITLIESDARKVAFLRAVVAATGIKVQLLNARIETITSQKFDIITARALAELSQLLEWVAGIAKPSTTCLFLKGKNLDLERAKAEKQWVMQQRCVPSITDAAASVICLSHIQRVGDVKDATSPASA